MTPFVGQRHSDLSYEKEHAACESFNGKPKAQAWMIQRRHPRNASAFGLPLNELHATPKKKGRPLPPRAAAARAY